MISRVLNTLVGVVAFAVSCAALRSALPAPEISDVTPKLRFLAQHRDDYDTIFIGSSRTHHGISPASFDKIMTDAGRPRRSFNFGMDGVWPPEQFYLIDLVLGLQPRTWRTVFIELNDVQVKFSPGVEQTQRAVYWHDWSRTSIIFRKLLALDAHENLKRKVKRLLQWRGTLWQHADLLCKNLTNAGAAANLAERFRSSRQEPAAAATNLGPDADGYDPVDPPVTPAKTNAYDNWLKRDAAHATSRALDPYAEEAFLEYAQQFRALGAATIFFTAPGSMALLPRRFSRTPAPPVLAFNDANAYPQLYRTAVRVDENHLNAAGAQEFTRAFAEQLLRGNDPQR